MKTVFVLAALTILVVSASASRGSQSGWGYDDWGSDGWNNGDWNYGGWNYDGWGSNQGMGSNVPVKEETRTIDELYAAALAEGGRVVVYAGGDPMNLMDGRKQQFETRFPGVTLDVIMDLSKYHAARIDHQLSTKTLVADMTELQMLQCFPRWRDQGVLLDYKPIGWKYVYDEIKDPSGAFTGYRFDSYGLAVNTRLMPNQADWPKLASRLFKGDLKGKIVGTYPNDDDAVLFYYKLMVDKYGWNFVRNLVAQNITFVRGSFVSSLEADSGKFLISVGTGAPIVPSPVLDIRAMIETDPINVFPQYAAIFKNAPRPNAAKLYMSWLLTDPSLQNTRFPARSNYKSPTNRTVWEYPNIKPLAFPKFMNDREAVEIFRNQMTMFIGEVQGPSPDGTLGTHPTKALPH